MKRKAHQTPTSGCFRLPASGLLLHACEQAPGGREGWREERWRDGAAQHFAGVLVPGCAVRARV